MIQKRKNLKILVMTVTLQAALVHQYPRPQEKDRQNLLLRHHLAEFFHLVKILVYQEYLAAF